MSTKFIAANTQIVTPLGDAEDFGGSTRAVEVAAMLGDSVIHVKHCVDPQGGKVSRGTWMLAATGLACLLSSAVAFKHSVDTAAYNKGAQDYNTNVLHKPAYAYRPLENSPALDVIAFGGLAMGIGAAAAALARARRERRSSPYYRVGTAPGVEQPLATAPTPNFPLVAPSGDDLVFNYGAGFDGELMLDGQTTSLAELAQTGRARPSTSTPGAIEIPIPARAKIRVRSGQTTFVVASVAKPKAAAVPMFALEGRTLAYFAGSLAVHLGLWGVMQFVEDDASSVAISLNETESTYIKASTTDNETAPPEEKPDTDTGEVGSESQEAVAMRLEEGAAGKPDAQHDEGHMRVAKSELSPQIAREQAIEQARTAGILGSTSALSSTISSLAADGDWTSGFDDSSVYGPLFGAEGEGKGNFGMGRRGFGPGGGCTQEPCGTVGAGRYGTIGPNGRGTGGYYVGDGGPLHGRKHVASTPEPKFGPAIASDGLDKEIIRRYIKRKVDAFSYCYEKQLMANAGLSGTITAQFLISANGTVQAASAQGLGDTAQCVADVIKTIKFPATSGGNVQVSYPFTFHPSGN
ncbi:MAG TPA: AgmX/PglI C-terminal domain-containing protein [Kofleriaceae bacterium]|jgi:hypothetical protein